MSFKAVSPLLLSFIAAVLLVGCESTPQTPQTPPAGVVVFNASPPPPVPGTKFHYKRNDGKTYFETVTEDTSPFKGRAVYRIKSSPGGWHVAYDAQTHNLAAVLDESGETLRYYVPHEAEFEYPMWIGKKYRTNVRRRVLRGGGPSSASVHRARVVGTETIETLMGPIETMRWEVQLGRDYPVTIWRARDIPVNVKHYNHSRGITRTLTKIELPN